MAIVVKCKWRSQMNENREIANMQEKAIFPYCTISQSEYFKIIQNNLNALFFHSPTPPQPPRRSFDALVASFVHRHLQSKHEGATLLLKMYHCFDMTVTVDVVLICARNGQ